MEIRGFIQMTETEYQIRCFLGRTTLSKENALKYIKDTCNINALSIYEEIERQNREDSALSYDRKAMRVSLMVLVGAKDYGNFVTAEPRKKFAPMSNNKVVRF